MSRLYKPFEMPVAFEGIFSRANTEDTVSRATTPTTMPECTDAPAQSFGSKRPRKETGDVLANIQNANIRKATPGGNIDAVRFEGGWGHRRASPRGPAVLKARRTPMRTCWWT